MNSEDRYDSLFRFYGEKSGVDWRLLKAQVKQESGFDADVRSSAGAVGLAQFMARTWQEWKDGTPGIQDPPPSVNPIYLDPRNPEDATRAQAAYMGWLIRLFKGDVKIALAAYNAGPTRLRALPCTDGFDAIAKFLSSETRKYVPLVMRFYADYISEAEA